MTLNWLYGKVAARRLKLIFHRKQTNRWEVGALKSCEFWNVLIDQAESRRWKFWFLWDNSIILYCMSVYKTVIVCHFNGIKKWAHHFVLKLIYNSNLDLFVNLLVVADSSRFRQLGKHSMLFCILFVLNYYFLWKLNLLKLLTSCLVVSVISLKNIKLK